MPRTFITRTSLILALCTALVFNTSLLANDSQLEVGPPSWWVGMHNPQLQLMLRGDAINNMQVTTANKDWRILSLQKTNNPNYLFVNLVIKPNAKAGSYQLQLTDAERQLSIDYQLNARQPGSKERQGFNAADVIYLITPDRFINGDTSNDQVAHLIEGINRQHEGGRYGGDLKGIIDNLDYLADMGYTQLWLNPVLENDQARYSYHGYSTTDYYQVDARYGDNALYKQLSVKGKQKGIGLIKDIILNHIGDAHPWMKDLPAKDWINNQEAYVETSHRRETLHDPHATAEDIEAFASGWFVPSMPDLNQRNPLLAKYLIQNSIWWIEYADLSGIRLDTYSYSDKAFLSKYTKAIMSEYPNFTLVGEEWHMNPAIIAYWQKGHPAQKDYRSEMPSMMDFPLQDALVKGLTDAETWHSGITSIYQSLAADFVYPDPYALTVFADNHDMSRIHTQLDHDLALTKMALTFIATTRGTPQIFYGTEVLMANPGTDQHGIIRSEFPGGWADHKSSALTGKGLSSEALEMQRYVRKLLNWRKQTKVIHTGKLTHYTPKDGMYVYFRHDQKQSPSKVMVVMNKTEQTLNLKPSNYPSMLSTANTVTDVFSGQSQSLANKLVIAPKTSRVFRVN